MLINQHSLLLFFEKKYSFCLFSYQKATNNFEIIFNMIFNTYLITEFLKN